MEIFNQDHEERKPEFEPIRGSIFLAFKILFIFLIFDGLYFVLFTILNLGIEMPFDLHHHTSTLFVLVLAIKNLFQLFLLLFLILGWSNNIYLLDKKHITKKSGIFSIKEEVYHFDNIRSISVDQSFFGKYFKYGNITLKTSASGGYQGDVIMMGISNPQKYEKLLKENF